MLQEDMPCGARLEVVQSIVQREGDVSITDHVDHEVRILPVLAPERLDTIVREELEKRGWTRGEDGGLTKQFGEATATLPAGASTIRIEIEDRQKVAITAKETASITEGDEAARAAVAARAEAAGDRKLEDAKDAAKRALTTENAAKLLREYEGMREELTEVINVTTRRALELRAGEIGTIDGVREGRASDGSYELSITVRT